MPMPRQPRVTNPETRNLSPHFLFPLPPPAAYTRPHSAEIEANMARGPRSDSDTQAPPGGRLPAPEDTRARVGAVLRKAYDDTVAEPVPDVFADLLRQLH